MGLLVGEDATELLLEEADSDADAEVLLLSLFLDEGA